MKVRETARRQYIQIVDAAAAQLQTLRTPGEGWVSTLRKALGMSGAQVAARAGVSRAAVYQAERNECDGAITIAQMHKLAEAMGGRFVYAVIPDTGRVEDLIQAQARRVAKDRVLGASAHMALEQQSLPREQTARRIDELTDELARDMPPGFWKVR